MNHNHARVIKELADTGKSSMICRGNSMLPVLTNPSQCVYRVKDQYAVGDIVLCKVKGRIIDAHFITKIRADGAYLIANNHGHENGWTRTVYGYVIEASRKDGAIQYRSTGGGGEVIHNHP